ncbi:hypothetical protein ACWD7F_07670 [Streptomyces sp. NPDC005122]
MSDRLQMTEPIAGESPAPADRRRRELGGAPVVPARRQSVLVPFTG